MNRKRDWLAMLQLRISGPTTFCALLLIGCASAFGIGNKQMVERLLTDQSFEEAAKSLAHDYLEGQKRGEDGTKYGTEHVFLNLLEYNIRRVGGNSLNQPVVFIRVKAGNRMGGILWSEGQVVLTHDPNLEAGGDKYQGLRIRWVAVAN